MESLTPVNKTGVSGMNVSRIAGRIPLIKNITGCLHAHQIHSIMTDLQTHVYNSAPMAIRTQVLHFWEAQGFD
jgi:hypothetical protein